jgi:HPt (histidine-containing phosphotransfer) domain-containing protein
MKQMDEMPLFDQTTLLELISELGTEDAAEVLKAFLADTSSKMTAIASDLEARSTIKREAHSIKSSAATFGFVELSTLARELESAALAMSLAELQESICTLRQAFERTENFARVNLLTSSLEIAAA